ncbi:MAG: PAS domain S-box protein [Pseudomonadota bacterium]|nr:PAS domain S-box protein [Pseudomonadota bacterium]
MNDPDSGVSAAQVDSGEARPDLYLTKRYRRLLFLVTLPLFIVIMVLAVSQYRDQRAQVMHVLAQNTSSYSIALDGIAKLANDHVLQMRAWSENYLRSPPSHPSDLRAYYKPRYSNGSLDGYTLDQVPDSERQYVGQLVWLGGDPRQPEVGEVALDQALEFFSLARLTHDVTPHFQWSYFFSARNDFVAVYPWFSAEEIIKAGDYASLRTAIDDWFQYEIYLGGTPEQNTSGKPYWTAPYIDAGGTGAMVSHGAPVYVEDEFLGIVGTDVRLVTLEHFLKGLPVETGRLMILNDQQMMLADTATSHGDEIHAAKNVMPGVFGAESLSRALDDPGKAVEIDGHFLVAGRSDHAPWNLVYVVTAEEITGLLLSRLFPYAIILLVLAATVFIALYLMRREFISPALDLVHYIRDASRDASVPEPRLPWAWQTWGKVVSQAFTRNREATRKFQESEARLQQILNNSSAVVYVRDQEERFLLVNKVFERLIGVTQSEIVGKQLEEVFPAETAAEFRANDMRVFNTNAQIEFEEYVTQKDGVHTYISSKFPLFDTDGEIYAVCGFSTDITARKKTEEILRQSALGISEARGEEVFNSLVMHLAKATGADYSFIGILEGTDRIRTRALYAHGAIAENITYSLEGSPCQNVVGQRFRFYPDRIQQRFPEDDLLKEIGVESYAAIPLFDSTGGVLGLMAILDAHPLEDEAQTESILQIFSGRAASELERERADEALRASEASYRAIFEASEDSIFVHDLETGRILDINQKTCETYGYSYEEMLEATVGDLSSGVPPYTQEDATRLIGRAVAGEHLNFEWQRKNKDGSLHWDEVYARRVPIGGHDRILVHTREITERKEADEKLRASEQQYREANRRLRESEAFKTSIVENALLAVITIDAAGRIVDFNPAAIAMFGHDRKLAIGSDLANLLIPERYRAAHRHGLARYQETGERRVIGKRLELFALRADGSEFPIELSISVNRVGDANYFTAFLADLTEKIDAEAALRASEEQYRSIFNAASDAMILWDARGHMVDVNPAAWKMGGYTREEFIKKPFDEHIHPSSLGGYEKFKHDVATVKAAVTETRVIRKDGTIIDLESRSVPMPYRGEPHILTITRDITEQKRSAEELARQRDALRQSEKMSAMGELLAGVAHELNNPLAILMGRAALLENKASDPTIQADVGKISAAAERCGRIVRTFLSMARQKPLECRPSSLNDVVTGAIDLLGYSLDTSGIELNTLLADSLPEPHMDTDQIGQIVINLLVNAQHVLAEQPQPRSVTVETGRMDGGVFCRVSDNGPGVPPELHHRIFDPFFTTKDVDIGTGVGLSVSRSIAREHSGELRLENGDSGAAFVLWLPLDSTFGMSGSGEDRKSENEIDADRVLIVDDEPEVAELLADILKSAGLETTLVHNGHEAMQWFERNTCDLILSDIRMPGMDGPELWRTLREQHPDLANRMAFITGDTLSASIAPFLKETGLPWLEKPFTPEQVLELVARIEVD